MKNRVIVSQALFSLILLFSLIASGALVGASSPHDVAVLESIAARPSEVSLGVAGPRALTHTRQLVVTAAYSDEAMADITSDASYHIDSPDVATVSDEGLITATGEGAATITVSYADGGVTKEAQISVTVEFARWLYDVDKSMVVGKQDALIALQDYFDGEISKQQVLLVLQSYFSGDVEILYYEHTRTVPEEEADNIVEMTEARDKIVFQELTDFVAGIQVGDILVSEHPIPGADYGVFERVVGVTMLAGTLDGGGAVQIEVEPATLEDVIERGVIEASGTISAETLLSNVAWAEGVEIAQVEGEYQFSYEPMAGVTIEGYLRVTADADVHIRASIWNGLQEFEFMFSPGLGMETTMRVEQDVSWSGEVIIGTITGPPIPIWGPVTITPKVELLVGTAGHIAATLETTVAYERGYDVGIRYNGGEWSTFSEIWGDGAILQEPTFSGQAEARVFGGAILSGRAGVSYVAEATLRAKVMGNVLASGEIENSPWRWQYDLELYLTAQVFADLELCRIAKVSWESPTWEYPAHPDPRYNLAYGASGRVTTEGGDGFEGVTINFSGDHSSATTNEHGYWTKHLLSGHVEITPEKAGYVFDPPTRTITRSASDLNFVAEEHAPVEYTPMVAASWGYTMGLKSDGTVIAVGRNEYGQCDVGGWTSIVQVSAGGPHTVGLKSDGTVVAVGHNDYGQSDIGGWTNTVQVAAGGWHSVGLKSDSSVQAVGDNTHGQCGVGGWESIVQVAAGDFHTVGLKYEGTVVAVGFNHYGQCVVGNWTHIVQVAAGGYHTVGLKSDGTVVAVGDNRYGQCDVNDWTDIVQISLGGFHTVGLKSDGRVVAVGRNDYGECELGGWTQIVQVAAGGFHTVALRSDGTVVAVGSYNQGQCDVGGWTNIDQVATGFLHTLGVKPGGIVVAVGWNLHGQCEVDGWTDIVQVAAGRHHTVGLRLEGIVVAVGSNGHGQCDVGGWTDIVQVAAGGGHTVGLKSNGTVVAVGENFDGQCDVSGWTNIVRVAAGCCHTVGLKSNGTVVAVGENPDGQCDVDGWTEIVEVAAGALHTVGLRSDGTVIVAGSNYHGQCDVDDWTDIVQVAAGFYHTVGLKPDGNVVTVGLNDYGQCEVGGWTDIVQVAAGALHTVGLKSDGTAVAAGLEVELSRWNLIDAVP